MRQIPKPKHSIIADGSYQLLLTCCPAALDLMDLTTRNSRAEWSDVRALFGRIGENGKSAGRRKSDDESVGSGGVQQVASRRQNCSSSPKVRLCASLRPAESANVGEERPGRDLLGDCPPSFFILADSENLYLRFGACSSHRVSTNRFVRLETHRLTNREEGARAVKGDP